MFWVIVAYLALYVLVSVLSVADEHSRRRPRWHVLATAATHLIGIVSVAAYLSDDFASFLGKTLLPIVLVGISWEVINDYKELRENKEPGESAPAVIALTFALAAPAFALGILASVRAW